MLSGDVDVEGASLDYDSALRWFEERGVLGECSVQLPAPLYADAILGNGPDASVVSILTIDHAREAFIDSLPAQASVPIIGTDQSLVSLSGLRYFQEWLARCAELKYGGLVHIPLVQRIRGLLENLFSDRRRAHVW